MSWFDPSNMIGTARRAMTAMVVVGTAALLSACGSGGFQPLYGTTASGTSTVDALAAVDVATIPGRVGQVVRNRLIFQTTGGDVALPSEYRLEVALRQSVRSILVETDGDARGQVYELRSQFKLVRVADKEVVLSDKGTTRAAFQRQVRISLEDPNKVARSGYSDIRARRDAENRAAREAADMIRTRVAAYLNSTL